MKLRRQQDEWEALARLDPLWAIASVPAKRHGGWDLGEFFATGEAEVAALLGRAARHGLPARHEAALDFGCGVGRLTRPLARSFDRCIGVDISPAMVDMACAYAADLPNAAFEVGDETPDLHRWPDASFDLVLTFIVLQHVGGRSRILGYVRELCRVLRPGGVLIFQLPSAMPWPHRLQPRPWAYRGLRAAGVGVGALNRLGLAPIDVRAVGEPAVRAAVERTGARVVDIERERVAGGVVSSTYWVAR